MKTLNRPRARACVEGNRKMPPPSSTSSTLEALAERLVRLSPSSRDPERFHVEKHTLAAEIRFLADQIRRHAA